MIKLKYLAGYCEVFSVFEESPGSFCDSDTVFAFSSVFELSEFFALEMKSLPDCLFIHIEMMADSNGR